MDTLNKIRLFAVELDISYGELMRLARECEENACLPSLAHMSSRGLEDLYMTLLGIRLGIADMTWFASGLTRTLSGSRAGRVGR